MNMEKITSILACEIECGVFEKHVAPALETVRKVFAEDEQPAIAWMVKGTFIDFFTDLEEAHKYAFTIGAKVIPLYEAAQ